MLPRAIAFLVFAHLCFAQAPDFAGNWLGTLQAGPAKLRLLFRITAGPSGLTATLDSLDQGAKGLPASKVTAAGRSVKVELSVPPASFEGTLSEDGKQIAGTFRQGGAQLPLTLAKVDAVPETRRPQDPVKPYPYDEQEVTYSGKDVKLAGTLTLPRAKGPHPAVLLLTGSGAQDRDESILGHRPFLVLADYLTRRGIAVLRMDDRGVGGSTGSIVSSTEEDLTADALAGVAFLKSRKDIDGARIGLAGHSEGGMIAALAASRSADVAFIVMLAGPGLPGDEIILKQVETLGHGAGLSSERVTANLTLQRRLLDVVKTEKNDAAALEKMKQEIGPVLARMPENARKAKEAEMKTMTSQWYRSFISTDPRPALAKIKVPVLALNGELDTQVPADESLQAIAAALKSGGNRDVTTQKLPGLNHLFQKAGTGAVTEYQKIDETINPEVLQTVGDWIAKRTAAAR